MSKNLVRKQFNVTTNWTCPGGVKTITAYGFETLGPTLAVTFGDSPIGLLPNGDAYNAGNGGSGNLGDGTVASKSSPVLVIGGKKFAQIAAGMGIDANGDAYAWGNNNDGQIGDGTVVMKSSPTLVLGGKKWRMVAGGPTVGICAGIDENLDLYAWGKNSHGALGDGTIVPKSSPVLVLGGKKWLHVAVSTDKNNGRMVGVDTNGDAYAWGHNVQGALGDGSSTSKSSPVAVLGGLKWSKVVSGQFFSAGLTTAGAAYAWGNNDTGQLGNNNAAVFMRSSPTAVVGGLKFMDLAVGQNFAVGITTGGDAYSWGDNSTGGELGDNTTSSGQSSPVAVVGGLKYAKVGCGFFMTAAMTQSGAIYSWGFNTFGQLGDGSTVSKSSPVAQLGARSYNSIRTLFKNSIDIPVTPGTTYSMATVAPMLQAAGVPVAGIVGLGGSLLIEYYE